VAYNDEAWGWPVRYEPEVEAPIPRSHLQFRPAVFAIGAYPIWFVSFTWEHGRDQRPSVLVEDENLVMSDSSAKCHNHVPSTQLHVPGT
jgi:hypothetical protein